MGILPNCGCCGRFVNPQHKGTSMLFVPGSDVSYEELEYRCAKCTQKYGAPMQSQNVVLHLVQYINK